VSGSVVESAQTKDHIGTALGIVLFERVISVGALFGVYSIVIHTLKTSTL